MQRELKIPSNFVSQQICVIENYCVFPLQQERNCSIQPTCPKPTTHSILMNAIRISLIVGQYSKPIRTFVVDCIFRITTDFLRIFHRLIELIVPEFTLETSYIPGELTDKSARLSITLILPHKFMAFLFLWWSSRLAD